MSAQNRAPDVTLIAETQAVADQEFRVVLKPLSHPDLGEIRIDESLFAVGRTEEPFASYPPEAVAELSRRHARIFSESGGVYIADLGSKNGTTVNGVSVREKPYRLRHGDEVRFAGELSYRVELVKRPAAPQDGARFVSLTLTPERSDLGLQPIVVTRFPFLVSKTDEAFARYRDEYPHQVNYVSRRHAHIFLKKGVPYVEDLGSTNGTFVAGNRLEEHAVPLEEGVSLAFGGNHFAYKVTLESEAEGHATLTKTGAPAPAAPAAPAEPPLDPDRTTFVAAADSFLDIFCIENPREEGERRDETPDRAAAGTGPVESRSGPRRRSRWRIVLAEARGALGGGERRSRWRRLGWAAALTGVVGAFAGGLYLWGAPEREVKNLLASGAYAEAAAAAHRHLARRPEDAALEALGTEALLKAHIPEWLTLVQTRDFAQASAVLDEMERQAAPNPDVRSLLRELRWVGDVEAFVAGRGGMEAPIRIFADEDRIRALVRRWQDDPRTHQRALVRVASHVPEFREQHARTLSTLRSLERDDSLYLAAIERLKTSVEAELARDGVQALEPILAEYGEKYPRIEGLDALRRDVRQYGELEREMRARRLGPLIAVAERARFETPPFQDRFRNLSGLPSPEVVEQYKAAAEAWRRGDAEEATRGLERLAGGPWGDVASRELERKRRVVEGFRALEGSRGAKGYEERLLAFHGELDPVEDAYFVTATATEVATFRDKALERARERLGRARELWGQYQRNGAIGGEQRLESGISNNFRSQARLLSEAREAADQGMRIYRLLKAEDHAQWSGLHEEINAEAQLQRRSLLELGRILEPGLLKAKLTLIGGEAGE